MSEANKTSGTNVQGKKRNTRIIIATVAVTVLALAVGMGIYNTPQNRIARLLDLGQKYLTEEDYEQAVLAFKEAIEIDPKCEQAYLSLADAYVGLNDLDSAQEILAQAFELIETTQIMEKMEYVAALREEKYKVESVGEEVKRKAESTVDAKETQIAETTTAKEEEQAQVIATTPMSQEEAASVETLVIQEQQPIETTAVKEEGQLSAEAISELESLLFRFSLHYRGNYDCTSGQNSDLLDYMVMLPGCYNFSTKRYFQNSIDPLGRFVEGWIVGYTSVSETEVDWVLKNIFNCPEAEIAAMKATFLSESGDSRYYLDGYYYCAIGGIGDPQHTIQIESIQAIGDKYQVAWSLCGYFASEKFYSAVSVVSRKIIDGKAYWSLYSQREL